MEKYFLFIYRIYALILLGILWVIVILSSFPLSLFGEKGKRSLWYFFHYCNRIWIILVGIRVRVEIIPGKKRLSVIKKDILLFQIIHHILIHKYIMVIVLFHLRY